jgi:hypothetical protein
LPSGFALFYQVLFGGVRAYCADLAGWRDQAQLSTHLPGNRCNCNLKQQCACMCTQETADADAHAASAPAGAASAGVAAVMIDASTMVG